MTEPIRLLGGIDHVTLVVKDLDKSRQFYAGALGMREVERPAFSFEGLWFQVDRTQIHLIRQHQESGPAGLPGLGDYVASRGLHIAFEVGDAHAAAESLTSRGIEIVVGPKQRPDGYLQYYFRDPDGHVVELFSRDNPS